MKSNFLSPQENDVCMALPGFAHNCRVLWTPSGAHGENLRVRLKRPCSPVVSTCLPEPPVPPAAPVTLPVCVSTEAVGREVRGWALPWLLALLPSSVALRGEPTPLRIPFGFGGERQVSFLAHNSTPGYLVKHNGFSQQGGVSCA